MKKNWSIILLLIFLSPTIAKAQSKKEFKEKFMQAFAFMEEDRFYKALPLLIELDETAKKPNMNLKSMIGYCYLKNSSSFEKAKAIPYYEAVQESIHPFYKFGDPKEKNAPVDAVRFLGQAYHANYEFDKALEFYGEYKEYVKSGNEEYLKLIDRDIAITNFAIELKASPINMEVASVGDRINSEYPDYRPIVSADDRLMLFTSRREGGISDERDDEDKFFEDIYYSLKDEETGEWQDPVPLNINTPGHEACLYLSPSGDHMFVYAYEEEGDGGIYESYLHNGQWTTPELLNAAINTSAFETHANMNAQGNMIAFVSDRKGTRGGRDIWFMKKLPSGEWSLVQNAGPFINTEYDEEGPYLHPDGKTLYFSSKGHNTMGGFDIFKSILGDDGVWSTPVNIGYPVNTTGDDVFFVPSADGKHAYLSSYREGGLGDQDIYIFSLPDEDDKDLALITGQAKDSSCNIIKEVTITAIDAMDSSMVGSYRPNSLTGRFVMILPANKTYHLEYEIGDLIQRETITVDPGIGTIRLSRVLVMEGGRLYLGDRDFDCDSVIVSNPPITDPPIIDPPVIDKDLPIVYFHFDQTRLIDRSKPDLKTVIDFMKANPTAKISVSGHCDHKGSNAYNMGLGQRRADAMKKAIAAKGVDTSRMTTKTFGEEDPSSPNTTPAGDDNPTGRQDNRRVVFKIVNESSL